MSAQVSGRISDRLRQAVRGSRLCLSSCAEIRANRTKGTPQGGPISPMIANIFLHYGFDLWMTREFPSVQFERFADDAVVHCVTERQAREVREAIGRRLAD